MAGQAICESFPRLRVTLTRGTDTFVTLLLPVFVLYDSKLFASLYLAALFGISTWNGASF